ncbi:atrial natriuretic peptide receptor 1-like [Strongylocentrotus purpuratus]|uniref:Guanylate cyclase n=1 Tax=Strongylocentrotus purpuratus TaxID=7668 RepID=A0A7M7HLK8_STRPU|nr:atrial natriuretic peptide receptor 1-like [Strongylocentrotus purpuratus]
MMRLVVIWGVCCVPLVIGIELVLEGVLSDYQENSIVPSIDLAILKIEELVHNGRVHNITIKYTRYNRFSCYAKYPVVSPAIAANAYHTRKVAAFIGPGCIKSILSLADLAAAWNLPLITGGAPGFDLGDKKRYSTLTRTSLLVEQYAKCFEELMGFFGWKVCSLIQMNEYGYWGAITDGIEELMPKLVKNNFSFYRLKITNFHPSWMALDKAIQDSRVIFMAVDGDTLREIMLHAYDLDLINGDYAFINIIPFRDEQLFGDDSWERGDNRDEEAKVAYQALMTIRVFEPTSEAYREFEENVRERQKRDFNITDSGAGSNIFLASAFYDVMILYSLAINETIAEGGDVYDGHAVTKKMWNRTFDGLYGKVKINENGDRDSEYSLWDMTDTENGTFEVVGNFYLTSSGLKYTPVPGKPIKWPGGATSPPRDTPFCGFNNENPECQPDGRLSTLAISGIAAASVLLLSFLILVLVYRKIRLDAELLRMSWKLSWDELVFPEETKSGQSKFSGSFVTSIGHGTSHHRQMFATVANYKGRLVVIRRIEKTKLDLTRDVLKELNYMRQVEHNNLVRFVGACVDAPNISIISEYCPKGSLQDIVENDALKLDNMFKNSLITDVMRGLHYLHSSVIMLHSRLSSSNCVVDSRFVLKLTDYGLTKFRDTDSNERQTSKNEQKMLWQAPETLRSANQQPTQKGDIYSVGIIMQEIVTRARPFEEERSSMEIDEIVKKLTETSSPPFRPEIDPQLCTDEIRSIIQACWEEMPENRPATTDLLSSMKKINKNLSGGNILDNLLSRMEQYATNLETLVEERTAAFLEEKKRSETLLYEVLPRSVAEQLKQGSSVSPKSYESVTIYFSDIVGFTSISADSTPLQVVTLLNDLYTCFDGTIGNFDVYKVETIGDAYMVVSGLPIRNGIHHVKEIASMALSLVREAYKFRIRHKPEEKLLLRVGVHSGACVAGVVGLRMPRYCLFGDTVNTASRMESTGQAMKVHISESTKKLLDTFKNFETEPRGEVVLKGKGSQQTYWLTAEASTSVIACPVTKVEV